MTVQVKRLPILLEPDASRVITRFFGPGEEKRVRDIIGRLLAIPEATVVTLLAKLEENFRPIHANIDDIFREHYAAVKHHIADPGRRERRAPAVHRRLLHHGVRDRVSRPLQPLDGAGH